MIDPSLIRITLHKLEPPPEPDLVSADGYARSDGPAPSTWEGAGSVIWRVVYYLEWVEV